MSDHTLDILMQKLLAFDQGRLARNALTAWCRSRPEVPAQAQSLVNFLANSTPDQARQFRLQAEALKTWLALAPLPQRDVLLRVCGGFALAGALLLQRDQQFSEADAILRLALELSPERSAAWLILAQVQLQQGHHAVALETLQEAVKLFPHELPLLSLQAQLLLQSGLGQQALESFEKVVVLLPEQPDAWLGLGNLRQALGDLDGALKAYTQALKLAPEHAGLWNNLGQLHHRRMEYPEAEKAYQQALTCDPNLVEAWSNVAALELDRGQLLEASAAVARAMALAPDYAPAWLNAGITEGLSGRNGKALAAFARARQLDPFQPNTWLEEASLLLRNRQTEQALNLLQAGLRQLPQAADLHWLYSRLMAYKQQPVQAEAAGQRALELSPNAFRQLQLELGWSQAHFLDLPEDQRNWLGKLEQTLAKWSVQRFKLAEILPELRFLPELLWGLNHIGDQSHLALRQAYASLFDLPATSESVKGSGREKLRLGVVITSGHEGIFMASNHGLPLLSRLPGNFELVLMGDPARLQIEGGVPVIPLPGHLPAAVQAVREARLDLLYFWEVGSDTLNYFMAFFRLAPIQFSSWGVLISSGIPNMDYYLSSRLVEAEDAQSHYSEKLLLADELLLYCPDPRLQAGQASREELGLPEGRLYVCLQNPLKYSQHFLMALQDILDRDGQAQLVLLASDLPWVQERLTQMLKQRGLLRQRVHWVDPPMPYSRFLNLFAHADVVLDTRECSGGQTCDDALLMGAPVVSFPGGSTRNRITLGRLKLLELDDCIVSNWPAYAERACELAQAGPLRDKVRQQLASNRQRLLENPAGPEAFSQLLEQMAEAKGLR